MKEHEITDAQKVIIQNLTTVVANANQAASLYLSQLAHYEWKYDADTVATLQFNIENLDSGVISVIEPDKKKKK